MSEDPTFKTREGLRNWAYGLAVRLEGAKRRGIATEQTEAMLRRVLAAHKHLQDTGA